MMQSLTPAQKMTKARNKLLMREPFFGVLALKLQLREDSSCSTAYTDGQTLGYNPEWIDTLPDAQLRGLVAHEVEHCVFKHHTRRKSRDPKKWNNAADHVINLSLIAAGFELPKGALCDAQYANMSTDHVYNLLPDDPEGEGRSGAGDPGGEVRDAPCTSSSQIAAEEQEWTVATKQAAEAAKMQGKLHSSLEKLIDNIVTPKIPWIEVLRNFMTQPRKDDYSWSRPNRRFINDGLYLPSAYSEGLGDVVIIDDTSGSISDSELNIFASETNCTLEDTKPERVYVLYCSDRVEEDNIMEYTPDDYPIVLNPKKTGGTDFTPPFEWIKKQGIFPDAIIYFTDLYGSCTAEDPGCPVLWISTTDRVTTTNHAEIPFGTVIQLS